MSTISKPEDFEGLPPPPDLPFDLTALRRSLSDHFADERNVYAVRHKTVDLADPPQDFPYDDTAQTILIVAHCCRDDGERRITFQVSMFSGRVDFPTSPTKNGMVKLLAQLAIEPREIGHAEQFYPAYLIVSGAHQ